MLKNYFKISIRNLLKHKAYSMINVLGLATGMACCMMILLFVKDELSYDQFHKNSKRIYRILSDFHNQGESQRTSVTSPPIGPALKTDFPEIEQAVRISQSYSKVLVKHGDKAFYENDFYYADPALLEAFSFPLSEGDAENALSDPNSVILSRASAEKYFGDSDPLGKTLTIEVRRNLTDYKVTGVLKDIPGNSTFRPNFIIPFSQLGTSTLDAWWHFGFFTYLLLSEPSADHELESKFPSFMKRHMPPEQNEPLPDLVLQPLQEVHLQSDFDNNTGSLGQLTYVYLFSALALFIILIACFNFMNLATARSQGRAREVGVRKTAGAARVQLISQFLCEALIMSFLSLSVAVVLVELFIPVFNEISGKMIYLNLMDNREAAAGFIGIALTVGLVSGSYPAFFLSKFKPIDVLKGTMTTGSGGTLLRKMLVVMQFAISVGLIFGT
ncbi:ABC transporter permease, partial [bacterium]|nr:ABC transporter permease [bacterium]